MLHQFKIRLFVLLLICVFALSACGAREETVAQGDYAFQEGNTSESQSESITESMSEPVSEATTENPSESEIIVMSEQAEIVENPTNTNDGKEVELDVYLTNANYTITNAEGETITITDGLYVGGTMPVLGRIFRGEGSVILTLTVPFSESFTFSGDNSERENFYRVIWGEQFSGAKGTGMEAVTITQSNVQLTGDNMEYLIRYSFAPEASYKAYLSGSDETFVMFKQTEDGFRATTENDAQFKIENLETQTVVLSESVAANSSYFLNYQINDQGVVSFEAT